MVTLMERLWKQALRTFSKRNVLSQQSFEENFLVLKSLADAVTAADVKLDLKLLERHPLGPLSRRKPPVTYIEIYEDDNVTIGIFILKAGVKLPLHDHPQMYGILKVISGTVSIQSYSVVPRDRLSPRVSSETKCVYAEKLPEVTVNQSDSSCTLTPNERNLHEIRSVDGPAAFLDILAPPYESEKSDANLTDRSCHYFVEKPWTNGDCDENIKRLCVIPSPPEFWSDSAPYNGPELRWVF